MHPQSEPTNALRLDTYYGWCRISFNHYWTRKHGRRVIRVRLLCARGGWYSPRSFPDRERAEAWLRACLTHYPAVYRVATSQDVAPNALLTNHESV